MAPLCTQQFQATYIVAIKAGNLAISSRASAKHILCGSLAMGSPRYNATEVAEPPRRRPQHPPPPQLATDWLSCECLLMVRKPSGSAAVSLRSAGQEGRQRGGTGREGGERRKLAFD